MAQKNEAPILALAFLLTLCLGSRSAAFLANFRIPRRQPHPLTAL